MKRFLLLAVLAMSLLSTGAYGRSPKYANRAEMIAAQIHDPQSKYVVVVCHRGDWRSYPENSVEAIASVATIGGDMAEIDLKMTKDSVLVLSHDATLDRCTTGSGKISDYTYAELLQFDRKDHKGNVVKGMHIATLREGLEAAKDKICVNVDQGYEFYEQVLAIAEELGVTDQILIKGSRPIDVVAAHESAHRHNTMYMPVVTLSAQSGRELFKSYIDRGVTPLAYELCWKAGQDDLFLDAVAKIKAQNSKIWVNTLWGSICGGDDRADAAAFKTGDLDYVYGRLLDNGVSMIQTDRPALLIKYLQEKGRHPEFRKGRIRFK